MNLQNHKNKIMKLALTVLGHDPSNLISDILPAIRDSRCSILELRSSRLVQAYAAYLLIQGNWNQIAKFESALEAIQKRVEIKIHSIRPEQKDKGRDYVPYSLETISLDRDNIIESITAFLCEREIEIEEITGSSYQAPYIQTSVFSTRFIILIPPQLRLLALREEFLDFCDQLNIDAILEPIKR